ncbi:hypothetical protein NA56DRAFT_706930 [Hyaloscypha hepaticicola]|uniref:Uncharacterized protein n=1 Tax=Hyaloscypha hepaticicola TaxID=2082293 RepID=A0A2J6PWC3_9HELO|nr:hypothetical protein NA56DRAFT_706930 [Hyaloscypha hepaticicola]
MSKVRYLRLGLAFNRNVSTTSFTYDLMFLSHELDRWLACFEGLRILTLGLSTQEKCWHNQFMTKFSEALSRVTFPQLVKLNFKRLLLIPYYIQPFILSHSSTLRYLGIDGGYFAPGDAGGAKTKEFLTTIRDRMKKLEKISFIPDHDHRLLIYHNVNWDPLPEDNTKPIKVTHLMEYYVLGKCLGADGIGLDGDSEIGSDDEEVDVYLEAESDLASLDQLLQSQERISARFRMDGGTRNYSRNQIECMRLVGNILGDLEARQT